MVDRGCWMDKKEYDDVIIIMEMEYKEKEKYVLSLSCVFYIISLPTRNVNVLCMSSCGRYSALG